MMECLDLPEPVLATVAEAERLGFAVQSVAENRIPAVDVDTDVESVVDALTVVFTRED